MSEPEFTSGERGGLGGARATGGGAGCRAAPLVGSGREAALALDPWFVPVDHTIVGIVDTFHRPEVPS